MRENSNFIQVIVTIIIPIIIIIIIIKAYFRIKINFENSLIGCGRRLCSL